MDLRECEEKGFIRKVRPNVALASSLIEMSGIKEFAVNQARLDDKNINAYLPMAYDALREVMEAVCIRFGYKVTNHICIGELMRKLVKGFDYDTFDRLRYARNSINYYGEKIGLVQGKELIKKIWKQKKDLLATL